jgi:hypothetical protein
MLYPDISLDVEAFHILNLLRSEMSDLRLEKSLNY